MSRSWQAGPWVNNQTSNSPNLHQSIWELALPVGPGSSQSRRGPGRRSPSSSPHRRSSRQTPPASRSDPCHERSVYAPGSLAPCSHVVRVQAGVTAQQAPKLAQCRLAQQVVGGGCTGRSPQRAESAYFGHQSRPSDYSISIVQAKPCTTHKATPLSSAAIAFLWPSL